MAELMLDNGRSSMLGTEFQDMLRCIRCGACLNHCPIYIGVGGHAYGSVYPGPMGSVLTPLLNSLEEAQALPNACAPDGMAGDDGYAGGRLLRCLSGGGAGGARFCSVFSPCHARAGTG